MQVMPWGCELRDAGVLHCKHSGSLALGSRSSFHGLAREIAARDLPAIEGWHAKRWAEPLANPRAHGKGLSRRVGLAPGRGAFARPRHAGPVRSSHLGMDSHRCVLPRVLTDSVDNRLPSSLLFAVLVVARQVKFFPAATDLWWSIVLPLPPFARIGRPQACALVRGKCSILVPSRSKQPLPEKPTP